MAKTVKELIEELSTFPPDHRVIMSSDGEGNNFSPFADAGISPWIQHNEYHGEAVHPDDVESGEYEGSTIESVVVLWPV